jgi:anaerobic selenocysteine-containing dehydrogenase
MLDIISLRRKPGTRKDCDQVITLCCQECTVGCGLLAYIKDGRIVDIQGSEHHPISRGRLCAKGIAFVQGLTADERITLPGSRNRLSGPFEAFDNWEKGIDLLAERMRRVKEKHGAESLVIGCDPHAGLDFYLGAQRFARLWATPHVYHPLQEAADEALPTGLRHPTLDSFQWSQSDCLVLIEADMAATHPVAFQRVLQAQRGGAKVIAADAQFTTTLAKADMAVLIAPNQGNNLGSALIKVLLEAQLIDRNKAQREFKDFGQWKAAYDALPLERLAQVTGVPLEKTRALARAVSRCRSCVLITGKRLAFAPRYGIWLTISRVMGWHDRIGGGWYPLESGGARLDPTIGLEAVESPISINCSTPFPYQPNRLSAAALDRTKVKALIGSGNCLVDFLAPLGKRVNDMDLTVYFGSFPNGTRQSAHMVFPATQWAERDNISFSDDGIVQWSPRALKPNDACRTGLGFWMRLAQRFGWEEYFPWKKANDLADLKLFYQWLFKNNPLLEGVELDRIEKGEALVYWRRDNRESAQPEAMLLPAPDAAHLHADDADPSAYPLGFQTTRTATHSGGASHGWPWTRELEQEMGVRIHPLVARSLDIENGETVVLASEDEVMEAKAAISRMVPPRMVWSPQRMQAQRVLIYRKGQDPEQARQQLKVME